MKTDQPFKGSFSVKDPYMITKIKEYLYDYSNIFPITDEYKNVIKNSFLTTYKKWININHNIVGLDLYNELTVSQGTTESFLYFYNYYKTKRLRLFKGEYFYHSMATKLWYNDNYKIIDKKLDLEKGDMLVLSVPFSDTGNIPDNLEEVLSICDILDIPVLIDLAYINLAVNLSINLNHKCIKVITTSLSKFFPVENFRIGMRMCRSDTFYEDQLTVFNENFQNYINIQSVHLGRKLINSFSSDYIYETYKEAQNYMCNTLDVEPSSCVIFGIDTKNKYTEYNRGGTTNRLCFSKVWNSSL